MVAGGGRPNERQFGHLLGPHIVVDLNGAEVGAGSFRQAAASIDLDNLIVMFP